MINLSAFIRFHAERHPEHSAIIYNGIHIDYRELDRRIRRSAGWLAARGIGAGDVVALLMKNSAAFIELLFAVSHLGAVLLPINYRLAAAEVGFILDNAGAKLLIADDEFAGRLQPFRALSVFLDHRMQQDLHTLTVASTPFDQPCVRRPDDLMRLMYTSGTTGHPKGVMLSYSNFYWKNMDQVIALSLSAQDRLLIAGPLYHVGALDLPGLAVLWLGGTLVILREFDARAALAAIERERLDGVWFAPVMLNQILNLPERGDFDLSSLRWCIGGGERTPESRILAFSEVFPRARYIDAYGLTESCSGDTMMEAGRELEKIGSTGRALAHVEVEIRDSEGRPLPAGEAGEICLRGPKITRGYWRDEEKTRASFYDDWFRSGDIGYLDTDGFLYLTDRLKDMIISGSENIASSEIERVVYALPQISEAAVIGVPDEKWGEVPVVVAVLKTGAALDYEMLATHCRQQLAGFKVPKALYLTDMLPRNPSGKVLKRLLREQYGGQIIQNNV